MPKTVIENDLHVTGKLTGGSYDSSLVSLNGVQTLAYKTLDMPILQNPHATYLNFEHDFLEGDADWNISAAGAVYFIHTVTNASGAVNCIVAKTLAPKIFINNCGYALTVKTADGTGISIANGKVAMVMSDGTNVIRLTPDI